MTAPMMRARLHGNPCRVSGHGSRCERVDDRRPVTRAQEDRTWRPEVDALLPEATALDDFDEFFGLTEADHKRYAEAPRGCCDRPNGDGSDLLQQPCSEGRCVELACPCGVPTGSGWGPVDCRCQESINTQT